MPGRQHRRHICLAERGGCRPFRAGLRGLPAAGSLHHGQRRADHYHFCSRKLIQAQRERCADPAFAADYRDPAESRAKTRPPGQAAPRGQRPRVRGKCKVSADFNLLAAAQNLARLASLVSVLLPIVGRLQASPNSEKPPPPHPNRACSTPNYRTPSSKGGVWCRRSCRLGHARRRDWMLICAYSGVI